MIDWIVKSLREHPELAIFLTLAMGFFIGRLKIRKFSLGVVVGTLLAGVLVGQLDIKVPATVKTVFFDLFLFATGYKVGPQFFRALKKDALSQMILTVFMSVVCLATAFVAAKVLGYDPGTAAGLLAGAFTESTVIGTATDAINNLSIPDAEKAQMVNNLPVAYAVTYLFGTGFVVWFLAGVGPKILRINLKEEAKKLVAEMGGQEEEESGAQSAYRPWDIRGFRITVDRYLGKTYGALEADFAGWRLFVPRVRRGDKLLDPTPETVIASGDLVAAVSRRGLMLKLEEILGEEVEDKELLDIPTLSLNVVITHRELAGLTVGEVLKRHGRGVGIAKLVRGGQEIPWWIRTPLQRGDLLEILGARQEAERFARVMGYVERASSSTDMIFVGLGILLGGLVGSLSVILEGLPITLTSSGGALVGGLVFGWLRSVRPTFGLIPEPALWVFDSVGLTVFIAAVGLGAGPTFISGIRQSGISLVVVGLLVAITPHAAGMLFGKHVLKMNPVILLGACSGAGTITAALRALQDESGSKLPVLGYTVPYAVGNILLTAWGPVIVALMSIGR